VSEQNVELHRRSVEAFNRRDIGAMLACFDPSVEYRPVLSAIGVSVYHGHDGMRSWFGQLDDAWEELRVEPEAYFDLGEQTLLFYVLHGRGRKSGAEVAMQGATVFNGMAASGSTARPTRTGRTHSATSACPRTRSTQSLRDTPAADDI
jgi:ketosteroid isomerase-like protein